jgi:hypothetical protein
VLELLNLLPTTANNIHLEFSTDGGSTWNAANTATCHQSFTAGANTIGGNASDSFLNLTGTSSVESAATNQGLSGTIHVYNPLNAAGWKHALGHTVFFESGAAARAVFCAAMYKSATAVNAVQIKVAGGGNTLASGVARLYGLTH